ncbi:MAG: hypothetical protein QOJ12_256, partial [Thermoleophilales bacterium]|nr:hypothetical protein [Thermoleophilales bacterium]
VDPEFRAHLKATVGARSCLVSNLLEHVADPEAMARAVVDVLPPDGLLIVSGPASFPHHPDPIDTLFRPTISELHALFPGTDLVDSATIAADRWRPWERGDVAAAARFAGRLLLPFYKPRRWRQQAAYVPYFFKGFTAFAVVLKKR